MSARPQAPAFLAVGSNLEPEKHIPAALAKLRAVLRVTAISTFYRTPPLADPAGRAAAAPSVRADFLNGVFRVETGVAPGPLKLGILRRIEEELGRLRTADKYAPRTLDLDLILYGNVVLDEPGLRLPDPDIRARNFIAVPLLELAPDLVLPDTGERLGGLAVAHDLTGMDARVEFTKTLREPRSADP
jgi:2-amino-4-hydroxy-6-hydroxymethyldihydropteridine diphosphokinase